MDYGLELCWNCRYLDVSEMKCEKSGKSKSADMTCDEWELDEHNMHEIDFAETGQ